MRKRTRNRTRPQLGGIGLLCLAGCLALGGPARAAATERLSERVFVSPTFEIYTQQGNRNSHFARISAFGRWAAFVSEATNLSTFFTYGFTNIFLRDLVVGQSTLAIEFAEWPSQSADSTAIAFQTDAIYTAFDYNWLSDIYVADSRQGSYTRVSVSSNNVEANGESFQPSISRDGRIVAFASWANNLVAGDTNGRTDVFVHDRQTATTERVSVSSAGEQANGDSFEPSVSSTGRYVAFISAANNLAAGDMNGVLDIFVRDRTNRTTERVSVNSAGVEGNGDSYSPYITPDGRYVVFTSEGGNLVDGDTNGQTDVFIHDRQTHVTERVSVSSAGEQGYHFSHGGWASDNGRYVAFGSLASNLVPGDTNNAEDIFLRDRQARSTVRVSVAISGAQANGDSFAPVVSPDGRRVFYESDASNLVGDYIDTNGVRDVFMTDLGPSPNIAINGGAERTNSPGVTLTVAVQWFSQVRFRDAAGQWGPWEAAAPTRSWVLPGGDGAKRVMVQGLDASGEPSPESWDEIILDTTPPTGLGASISGGAACTDSANVTLTLLAAGADTMRLRDEGDEWSGWESFAASKPWILSPGRGLKKVFFQCRDAAGNESAVVADEISVPLFDDVPCGYWARGYVEALARAGVARGCAAQPAMYCPADPVTRGQMAKLICGAAGKTWLDRPTATFADVPRTHPFFGWIERLADAPSWGGRAPAGGCQLSPVRKFCPGDSVTREQTAKLLCLAAGKSEMPSGCDTFADVGANNLFCGFTARLADAASWPGGAAVTSGCKGPSGSPAGARYFCPKNNASRGEMAAFLVRAFGIPM
jgi:Tol biopolymer transport system component